MEKRTIRLKVNGQNLELMEPLRTFSSDTVNYIRASFIFSGDAWSGYDNILAIWYTDTRQKESEIIDGETVIPSEVLADPGILCMNLCANKASDGVLVARMTSYPVNVLRLTAAHI